MKPTKQEINKFVEVVNRAFAFEAEHRYRKGWGAFAEYELPVPEVKKFIDWVERESWAVRLWNKINRWKKR